MIPNLRLSYAEAASQLLGKYDRATAMSLVVGGDYEFMGDALRVRLERFGLKEGDYLIDIGCGSGRLAYVLSLSKYRNTIRYLGIDIVPAMLEFAVEKCQCPSWRFELVTDLKIPEADECADMVCFFSVFTHLMQEESFIYLREAQRVLKPGGKIVISYFDMADLKHWEIFEIERKLGARPAIQTDGYFSFGRFSKRLGTKIELGDSEWSRARLRSANLNSAKALIHPFGLVGLQRSWWFWIGREVHSA